MPRQMQLEIKNIQLERSKLEKKNEKKNVCLIKLVLGDGWQTTYTVIVSCIECKFIAVANKYTDNIVMDMKNTYGIMIMIDHEKLEIARWR